MTDALRAISSHTPTCFTRVFCATTLVGRITSLVGSCLALIAALWAASKVYSRVLSYRAVQDMSYKTWIGNYPPEGKRAIEFAMDELRKSGSSTPAFQWENFHQPVNRQIALLMSLYIAHHKKLEDTLKLYAYSSKGVWNEGFVLKYAKECMQIAYTISCFTLEDLDPFRQRLASLWFGRASQRSRADALAKQDSYQFRAFYCCTLLYHDIRCGMFFNAQTEKFEMPGTDAISPAHAAKFLEEHTSQAECRKLYNHFCRRAREIVPEEELRSADSRHVKWTIEDIQGVKFVTEPDSLPT